MPTTYYLISDLHIGGDGGLAQCEFERELVAFLAEIAVGPQPAELVIVGDAFGFWELTDREGVSKLETIAAAHPALFHQLRETGARVTITLLPGNHDYDLACVPEYKAELARYNVRLEPVVHITRAIAGRTVWIEHGNQYDDFNRFPDFGNRYGLPLGYFITRGVVASAGRSAERTKAKWLDDVQSVYPNEDIPFWLLSSHFYKEMTPLLRWALLPFLLLFTASAVILGIRALERLGGRQGSMFDIDLQPILGFPGRIIDFVQFVNSTVIVTLLILAVPLYFLMRDIRANLRRGPVGRAVRVRAHPHSIPARGRPTVHHQHRKLAETSRLRARSFGAPARDLRALLSAQLLRADGGRRHDPHPVPDHSQDRAERPHLARAASNPGPSCEDTPPDPSGDVRRTRLGSILPSG
jgi:UDP-2,3-diacylglucosamine pyrophosphatase LpxH